MDGGLMRLAEASSAVAAHGQCALKSGVAAADARICDTAGANETLCHLANTTCTWVSAAEEARLEHDYELELWLPIVGIVLVVLCPLLCWPVWCSRQRSSLETPIVTAAATSINSHSAADATLREVDEAAKIAAAHAFRTSFLTNDEAVPGRVDPGLGGRQLLDAKRGTSTPASATVAPVVAPLPNARTTARDQLDASVGVERDTPPPESPAAALPTFASTPGPPEHHRRGSSSPTHSEASSINSDDFDDALEHDSD
jgi:hypothetical protein